MPDLTTRSQKPVKLSKRQQAFLEDYISDYDHKRAYYAHFSAKNDTVALYQSKKIINSPQGQEYLSALKAERTKQYDIDAGYVLKRCVEILEADLVGANELMTEGEISQIPAPVRKLIQSVELAHRVTRNNFRGADVETEERKFKITWMSKDKALELIAKYTGKFDSKSPLVNIDKAQLSFTDGLKQIDDE